MDLFAGSGSVGIEALSQGAADCTFIDLGQPAVATIKRNLATTGFTDRAEVRQADAFVYLRATDRAFDLIYVSQGALAGPDFSTDILGTFLYRTFFGFQLQEGDPYMGSAVAAIMFFIILGGVCLYLFGIQRRLRRYQL